MGALRLTFRAAVGSLLLLAAAPAGAAGGSGTPPGHYSSIRDGAGPPAVTGGTTAGAEHSRKIKFNTFPDWDGFSVLSPFGHPDTATYGQTFTSPSRPSELKKFAFNIAGSKGAGRIVFLGEVYRWDGEHATGPVLWESEVRSKRFWNGDYREVGFITSGTEPDLEPSTEYVVFVSVSKTYEETTPNSRAQFGFVPGGGFDGGHAVWLNNGGDESLWTSEPWSYRTTGDFVTRINLKTSA